MRGDNGFKFEANWLKEEDYMRVVEEAWMQEESGENLSTKLKSVASSLKLWSSNSLGDLEKRLKEAKRELEKWRRVPIGDHTVAREAVWSFKVDRLEDQIDTYWRQRVLAVIINQIRPPIIVQNRRNKQSFDIYAFTIDIVPLVLEKTCFAGHTFKYKWKTNKMRNPESVM